MARTSIGVDVGSSAVRVAEVAVGDIPVVVRAAQVPLAPGVVQSGEVRQPEAVAEALRKVWAKSGVKSKRVHLGVGNERVVVREIALPWLPEKELRDTLAFQVQEFILALPSGPTGATGTTGVPTAPPSLSPSPTPRETLPPVSLAGSRDPFSIPAGLELSTGGSVSPTTTASSAGTTTAATTIPTTITTTVPTTIPTVPTTTATTTPPPPDGGDGDRPGNNMQIGGHNVKLVSVAGNGKKLECSSTARSTRSNPVRRSTTTSSS
jgi:hypothetical protein